MSGGVVTELIYKSAFVVRDNEYKTFPITQQINGHDDFTSSQKSRYLPVSHKNCAEYIINHPDEKIILVGTSCFVHGIINLIREYNLKRDNYLIIGLFCDRIMSLNVIEYFRHHSKVKDKIKKFYFRTKDSGGWPGGVRIIKADGQIIDLPNTERMKVKDFFQPERCLYCLDKLNVFADFSCGDNYTGIHSDKNGSSSIIIRSRKALQIWNKYNNKFEVWDSNIDRIIEAQHMKEREKNYIFSLIKESEIGSKINYTNFDEPVITPEIIKDYNNKLSRIRLGESYNKSPSKMLNFMRMQKLKSIILRIFRKIFLFS